MPVILAAAGILALILLLALACFFLVFYAPPRKPLGPDEYPMPRGEIYKPYTELMLRWMRNARTMPHETFRIRSFDGLTLCGNYYEYAPNAPLEIMFHGYRGCGERDLSVGIQRAFSLGRSVLLVEQRTSCGSEGHVITFGVREHRDCLAWVDYLIQRFGTDVKIILTGISMGAATVMIAGGTELPSSVVGIIADCGYTSTKEIIQKVIGDLHLPPKLAYPFVKLGARLYGGFDLEEVSPIEAMKKCRVPVFFIHGEGDDFVPCSMCIANSNACSAPHKLFTVPGAGHGLAYMLDPEGYHRAITELNFPNADH